MITKVHWLGHASFRIDASAVIYFDPWEISKQAKKADIILITHEHFDHFSIPDINELKVEDTVIIGSVQVGQKLSGIKTLKPGEKITLKGAKIQAFPAYNLNKFAAPGKPFHPKQDLKVGYVVEIDGMRIYHAGDTDNIPELSEVKDIDIALLPASGTYVMTADEAAQAANRIMPKIAVPMHYGKIVGTEKDAKKFAELCKCETRIMEKE